MKFFVDTADVTETRDLATADLLDEATTSFPICATVPARSATGRSIL